MRVSPRNPVVRSDDTITALFAKCLRTTPQAIAVRDADASMSYAELDARSSRLAAALLERNVGPNQRVGVTFDRSIDMPVALLGILKCGAAYVPLDASYPATRIAFMLADAQVSAVVIRGQLCEPALFDGLAVVDMMADAELIASYDAAAIDDRVCDDDLAYVTYTSGSSGRPKGVAISHRNVARLVRDTDYCEMSSGRTFLHYAPLAFDASTFEIWAPLLNGATLAIPRPGLLSIAELGEVISRFGVTTLWLTTAIFNQAVESRLPIFGTLQHVLTGGDAASARHVREFLGRFPSCRLSNGYGPTENTTFSLCCDLSALGKIGPNVPIGRPISRSTAYILDDNLKAVERGTIGELVVGGDGVGIGYIGLPKLTDERFVPDPFQSRHNARMYRTGDLASEDPDGLIVFHGRTDNQVKVRGFRIELGEVEAAMLAVPGIVEAVVVVVDEAADKSLFAFVSLATNVSFESLDIRRQLVDRLPTAMMPHHIEIIGRMPGHASGKPDRIAMKERAAESIRLKRSTVEHRSASRARSGARASVARTVSACWHEILGEANEADMNFFDAGGDSLRLLKLHEALARELGIDFAATVLFEHSTIAAQTAFFSRPTISWPAVRSSTP